ncbi:MAG: FliM/FliN family flagellar motor switch protein [Deltaproteobacteria bacterium]|nr:FliM/FliN family flagellar motor switch protein [Deltaproteobacteria bacterium]
MSELLSVEILEDILATTGATEDGEISRVVQGEFPKFDFKVKKRSEFDLSIFENSFDLVRAAVQTEISSLYLPECQIKRDGAELIDLKKYDFRAKAVCLQFKSNAIPGSFFVYFGRDTLFCLLNEYLGGGLLKRMSKNDDTLTDIEVSFLKKIGARLLGFTNEALNDLEVLNLELASVNLSESEQKKSFENPHLVTELYFSHKDTEFKIAFTVPSEFLTHMQEKLSDEGDDSQKRDPEWQHAITNAFFTAKIPLVVSLGSFKIPFAKSITLKEGDFLPWDRSGNQVVLFQGEEVRMKGNLGVVNEQFAVRVNEVFQSTKQG